MEPESPAPYPQLPATCPYPEPNPSSPQDPPPPNFLKIHLRFLELHSYKIRRGQLLPLEWKEEACMAGGFSSQCTLRSGTRFSWMRYGLH
jgi:hypothetical protein